MGQVHGEIDRGCYFDCKAMATQQRVEALKAAGLAFPPPQSIRVLIDTGASSTSVDHSVIASLGLDPTGFALVHTPTTSGIPVGRALYDLSIVFGEGSIDPRTYTIDVIETDFSGQPFALLLGWDILSRCVFRCDGPNGMFSLSF